MRVVVVRLLLPPRTSAMTRRINTAAPTIQTQGAAYQACVLELVVFVTLTVVPASPAPALSCAKAQKPSSIATSVNVALRTELVMVVRFMVDIFGEEKVPQRYLRTGWRIKKWCQDAEEEPRLAGIPQCSNPAAARAAYLCSFPIF